MAPGELHTTWTGARSPLSAAPGCGGLVALRGNRPVGYMTYCWYPTLLAMDDEEGHLEGPFFLAPCDGDPDGGVIFLESLWVVPSARGAGVMGAMVAELGRFWLPVFAQFRDETLSAWFARRWPAGEPLTGWWEIGVELLAPFVADMIDDVPLTEGEIADMCDEQVSENLMPWTGWFGGEITRREISDVAVERDLLRVRVVADVELHDVPNTIVMARRNGMYLHGEMAWSPRNLTEALVAVLMRPAEHRMDRSLRVGRVAVRRLAGAPGEDQLAEVASF